MYCTRRELRPRWRRSGVAAGRVGDRCRWRAPSAIERTPAPRAIRAGSRIPAICQNPAVSEPPPPVAPARPTVLRARRRRAHRPVVLAARPRRPRGARLPRSGERVHRRARSPTSRRCASELYDEIVARVQETDASAPVRRGDVRVLHPHRRGPPVRRALPAPGAARPALPDPVARAGDARRRDGRARRERARRRPRLLRGRRPRGEPRPDRRRVHAPTRPAASATSSASATLDDAARDLPDDVVPDVYYGVAWANDDRTVFYTRPDDAMRPWQIWRHTLGTPADDDVLVFQEDDDRFFVSRRPHPQRTVPRDHVGVEGDERGVAGRRRRRRPPRRASSSRASRVTSTTSSTTPAPPATGSSCSPTPTAPRTSR